MRGGGVTVLTPPPVGSRPRTLRNRQHACVPKAGAWDDRCDGGRVWSFESPRSKAHGLELSPSESKSGGWRRARPAAAHRTPKGQRGRASR
eukprot:3780009-Prymnesium_polylepis.1